MPHLSLKPRQDASLLTMPPPINPFAILWLFVVAWLTQLASLAHGAFLTSRTHISEAQCDFALHEYEIARQKAAAQLSTEEAQWQVGLQRRLHAADPEHLQELLLQLRDIETLRQELAGIRLMPSGGDGVLSSPIELQVSDKLIEQLAVRAVTRFSQLPENEAERAWADWERDLKARLPAYVVADVVRRSQELRQQL